MCGSTAHFIATDETEKYTDVRVILVQLSGGTAAGTENRRDKVHTLQLEGYRKFGSGAYVTPVINLPVRPMFLKVNKIVCKTDSAVTM